MSTHDAVLTKFREYTLGPMRFMNLLSCFELGIVEALKNAPHAGMTAGQLGEATGVRAEAVEQMLFLLVKEDFVSYDEASATYALDGLRHLTDDDFSRVLPWMNMIKVVCLRQIYYLTESIRSGELVGLKEFYDFEGGTFYEASTQNKELMESWTAMMDQVTTFIDPWFFENLEVPQDAKILDLAGNTGLGAVLARQHKSRENVQVACFDFPEKEAEALATFKEHGVEDHCSFIGGNVFESVPKGFDIVMIKHFLDMFDKENVHRIFKGVHSALDVGGQVYVLVPIYPEDIKSSSSVDFFPTYFYGCTMAQGGPQKVSTYAKWAEECGFEVTKVISQDLDTMPADMIPVHGIICATKTAS